ncbi:tape measure protein [Ligilactobacillus acidipiscis]|uniref:Phage tail length tape-measure protein n=1 Tax=Ligilactobacillus acidipiscis TaxID=89059 RepID=A0A1K1KNV0_9LACO|nr:tape measure protein [Ligilactobacillus acidipiscis]SFV40567.1 Phage tail length tape-measure protein [Ligilactobacillus acidipiscis]
MASDGRIRIDIDMAVDKAMQEANKVDKRLESIGQGTGDQLSEDFNANAEKVSDKSSSTSKKVQDDFSDPVKQKLEADDSNLSEKVASAKASLEKLPDEEITRLKADAEDAGITDFDKLLEALPEEEITKLLAKAEKGEVIDFDELINEVPKKKTTNLKADAEEHGIVNFDKLLQKLPKSVRTKLEAMAEEDEVIDYEKLLHSIPTKYLTELELNDNASEGLRNIQNEAEETKNKFGRLKDIIKGSFIGGAVLQGVSAIGGYLKDTAGEAMNASDAMQGFQATMELAGKSSKTIKAVGKDVKQYADETVYDLQDVSNTTAQLAANGVKGYEKLTEAAGNLTAVAGGTKDDFKSVTMVMTQTAGAGKLTTENWNQLTDAIPGASGKLQEAMKKNGAYTGDFRDAMADGQISAKEFNKAIEELGMTDKAKEYAKGTAAFEGAFGNLKSEVVNGVQAMIDAVGKSNITGAINGLAGGVSKAFGLVVSSVKPIKEAFKDFGKAFKDNVVTPMDDMEVANIFDDMGKGFSSVGKALKPVAKAVSNFFGMFAGATVRVWSSLFDGIIKGFTDTGDSADKTKKKMNFKGIAGTINKISDAVNEWFYNLSAVYEPLGKIIGIIAKSAFDTFADIISGVAKQFGELADKAKSGKGPLGTIAKVLTNLSKHEKGLSLVGKAIGYIGTSIFALKGAGKVLSGVSSAVGALTRLPKSIGKLGGEIAYKLNVKTKPARKAISTFATYAKKAGGGIKKALTWSAKVTAKAAKKTVRGLVTVAKTTGRGIRLAFNFLKANPFVLIVSAIAAVIAILVELYKHNKKFRKFVNGIVKSAKGIFSGVTKWFGKMNRGAVKHVKNLWNGTKKHFSNGWNNVKKWTKNGKDNIVSGFNNMRKNSIKHARYQWKSTKSHFKSGWKSVKKLTGDGKNAIINQFKNMKKNSNSAAKSMWKTANRDFKNGSKVNQNLTKTMKDVVNGHWGNLKGDLSRTGASIKKTAHDHFAGMYNSLNKLSGGKLGVLKDKFTNFGKSVKGIFKSIKDSIKKHIKNGINGAIGWLNKGIGGINSIIHTFGGSKNAIHKIKKLKSGGSGYRGIAQVNDGNGEEAILKGGQAYKVTGKNAYVNLEGDETVVPHEASRSMFGESIAHYAGGSKNWFSSLTGWVKDKWDGIVNFIKHPIKSLGNIVTNAMGRIRGSELVTKVTPALGHGLVKGISGAFVKMLKKLKNKHDEDKDAPKGAGVQRWKGQVKDALKANGLSTSTAMVNKVLRQIATESSGNEKAVQGNIGDNNNKTGDLAKGLMQTISTTFYANAFKGHHNIFNGYDNLLAALRYAKKRYGSSLSFLGNGHGYNEGGHPKYPQLAWLSEHNPEYVVNARKDSADGLLMDALNERAAFAPNSLSAKIAGVVRSVQASNGTMTQPTLTGSNSQSSNQEIVMHDYGEKLDSLGKKLDAIVDKRVTVDGQSFSKAYENYGSVQRVQRQQFNDRGLAINANI